MQRRQDPPRDAWRGIEREAHLDHPTLPQHLQDERIARLRALDDLQNRRVPDTVTTQNDTQMLKAAEKPQAVLRNMAVAPVETLVQAAGAQKP